MNDRADSATANKVPFGAQVTIQDFGDEELRGGNGTSRRAGSEPMGPGPAQVLRVVREVQKVILGQDDMIWKIVIALLADGHVLLEGAPGLAKSLLVAALGRTIRGEFARIQMMPDVMPSDLVGTYIFAHGEFEPVAGPIVPANLLLVDEINRAAPKTQAALLQAMQERRVTILGRASYELPDPFMVLATQNPLEHEGTYPLPEAQLDRFLMKVLVDYPFRGDEIRILQSETLDRRDRLMSVVAVLSGEEVVELRERIKREVHVGRAVQEYIVDLVRATRMPEAYGLKELKEQVRTGASPRASLGLRDAARVQAYLEGRDHVLPEDVQTLACDVLRHRLILTYAAAAEGITPDEVIERLVDEVPVP